MINLEQFLHQFYLWVCCPTVGKEHIVTRVSPMAKSESAHSKLWLQTIFSTSSDFSWIRPLLASVGSGPGTGQTAKQRQQKRHN